MDSTYINKIMIDLFHDHIQMYLNALPVIIAILLGKNRFTEK